MSHLFIIVFDCIVILKQLSEFIAGKTVNGKCVDIIGNHILAAWEKKKRFYLQPKQVKLKPFSSEFLMEV